MCKRNILIPFRIIATMLIASCSKDNTDQAGSPLELVTGTQWQLAALYLTDSPYVQRSDFTSQYYSPCELDDTYEFKADSILNRKAADTTCVHMLTTMPDDGASWHLDSINTYLKIEKQIFFNSYSYNCKILTLNKNAMELQSNFRNYFNQPSALIFSFKAIK